MDKLKGAVIGCGSIGALRGTKYDSPSTEAILTHAHAIYASDRYDLVGLCDRDESKARAAGDIWGCNAYTDIRQMMDVACPDVVTIATPANIHLTALEEVHKANHKPKVIIIEKPCGANIADAREIHDIATSSNDIKYLVNYTRRYVKDLSFFIDMLNSRRNDIIFARVVYGRGLARDCSHALEMLDHIFGTTSKCITAKLVGYELENDPTDPSVTAILEYGNVPVMLNVLPGKYYSSFIMDFFLTDKHIMFIKNSREVNIYHAKEEPTYGGFKSIAHDPDIFSISLTDALPNLYNHAFDIAQPKMGILSKIWGEFPKCTTINALNVHEVMHEIGMQIDIERNLMNIIRNGKNEISD